MKTGRIKGERIVAFFLSLIMVLTMFNSASFWSYAQGSIATATDAVVEGAKDDGVQDEGTLNGGSQTQSTQNGDSQTQGTAAAEVPVAGTTGAEAWTGSAAQAGNAQLLDVAITTVGSYGGANLPAVNAGMSEIFTAKNFKITVDGKELEDGMTVDNGAEINISFEWFIEDNERGGGSGNEYYYDLKDAEGISLPKTEEKAFNLNGVSGYWWIDEDGKFYIRLDEESNNQSNRNGFANLTGQIKGDDEKDGQKRETHVQVGDKSCDITVDMTPGAVELLVKKTATTSEVNDEGVFQKYEVTLRAKNGDLTITNLEDIFDNEKLLGLRDGTAIEVTLPSGSVDTYTDWADLQADFTSYSLLEDEEITITYEYKVSNEVFKDEGNGYNNTVQADYTTEDNEDKTAQDTAWNLTVNLPEVTKTAMWVTGSDQREIEWTITIKPGDLDWNNVTGITDILEDYLQLKDGSWDKASFTDNRDGTYTCKFTTTVSDALLEDAFDHTITNTVNVDMEFMDTTFGREGTGTIGIKKENDFLQKEFDQYDPVTGEMRWKVTVNIPESAENATVKPSMRNVQVTDAVNGNNHQVVQKIYLEDASGTVLIYDKNGVTAQGKKYLVSDKVTDSSNNVWRSSITLTFSDTYIGTMEGKSFVLYFATIATDDGQGTYNNKATLTYLTPQGDTGSDPGEDSYTPPSIVTKTGKQITVKVKDNESINRNVAEYTVALNLTAIKDQLTAGDTLTFTDTLPEHMIYDETFKSELSYYNYFSEYYSAELTLEGGPILSVTPGKYIEGEQQKVTFSITVNEALVNLATNPGNEHNFWGNADEANIELRFTYRTKVAPEYGMEFIEKGKENFENRVTASRNGNFIDDARCELELESGDVVYKDGVYTRGAAVIPYTVYVNPDRINLADGDFVTGTDISGSALIMDTSTIVVRRYNGNKDFVTDTDEANWTTLVAGKDYFYTYNAKTKTAVFTLPDEAALKITYNCKINLYRGSLNDEENDKLTPENSTNTFVLEGVTNNGTSNMNGFDLFLSRSEVGGYAETTTLDLYKYWTDGNQMVALNGSVFELRKCETRVVNGVTEVVSNGEIYKGNSRITLDENGKTQIKGLEYQNIYALCEIDADEGFLIGEPYYFAIYYQNSASIPPLADYIDKFLQDGTIYYENFREGTVNISKVDADSGEELVGASLTVTDGNGKEIASWVTDGDAYEIIVSKFETNREYTLTETKAPEGYLIATPIVFKLDSQYKIYIKGADGTFVPLDSDTIVMKDEKSKTSTDTTTETETSVTTTTSNKTNTTTAKTGDQEPLAVATVFLLLSATGLVMLAMRRRKR